MVGAIGFEPTTPSSRTRCSTRLSHAPTNAAAYTSGLSALQARWLALARTGYLGTDAGAMKGETEGETAVPLSTRVSRADAAAVGDAVHCLKAGGLVAFPTETVYGLGADATNARAVARLYDAKGRPAFNPLIAHVTDAAAAKALARFNADAAKLAAAFWPGPLTLVLPKTADCPVAELATAGLDSIAVRVPHHDVAQKILAAFGL